MRTPFPRELCDLGNDYFVDDIIQVEENEVFIDAGAYRGDTIDALRIQEKKKNIKGISDINAVVKLSGTGANAKISDDESDGGAIAVVKLDSLPDCQDATWIKMDIEGAELPALKGAEEIIRRNHPKLAICIYHSDEDMIQIAEYIHGIVPDYKFYVRHHYPVPLYETVLYAIP